jgi:hypothetical protein
VRVGKARAHQRAVGIDHLTRSIVLLDLQRRPGRNNAAVAHGQRPILDHGHALERIARNALPRTGAGQQFTSVGNDEVDVLGCNFTHCA